MLQLSTGPSFSCSVNINKLLWMRKMEAVIKSRLGLVRVLLEAHISWQIGMSPATTHQSPATLYPRQRKYPNHGPRHTHIRQCRIFICFFRFFCVALLSGSTCYCSFCNITALTSFAFNVDDTGVRNRFIAHTASH